MDCALLSAAVKAVDPAAALPIGVREFLTVPDGYLMALHSDCLLTYPQRTVRLRVYCHVEQTKAKKARWLMTMLAECEAYMFGRMACRKRRSIRSVLLLRTTSSFASMLPNVAGLRRDAGGPAAKHVLEEFHIDLSILSPDQW